MIYVPPYTTALPVGVCFESVNLTHRRQKRHGKTEALIDYLYLNMGMPQKANHKSATFRVGPAWHAWNWMSVRSIFKLEKYNHNTELSRNMQEDVVNVGGLGGVEAQHQLLFLLSHPLGGPE